MLSIIIDNIKITSKKQRQIYGPSISMMIDTLWKFISKFLKYIVHYSKPKITEKNNFKVMISQFN